MNVAVDAPHHISSLARGAYGSDRPVVKLAGGYDTWHAATETLLAALPPADRLAIPGGTAVSFYGLTL